MRPWALRLGRLAEDPEQFTRQAPARRQERERVPAWPADHRPSALQQHAPDSTNTWVGNVYNPVEGRIYTDVKLTLVSRQQIVLRGCRTWLMCGEKTWTRSTLPPDATTPQLIEVKAPAEPGTPEKSEPRSMPQPEAPMIEASNEREPLSAPGFTLVTTSASQPATLRRRRSEHGDDGSCASAGHGRAIADRDCCRRRAVAVDAAPFGAARLNSECGPGPSRTRSAEFCEAKAEAVRHGIARAVALDTAPFPSCGPGPSASTRSAYCREGKAEAGRQGSARAVALGAAPFGGRRRYADCRILGSAHPTP